MEVDYVVVGRHLFFNKPMSLALSDGNRGFTKALSS